MARLPPGPSPRVRAFVAAQALGDAFQFWRICDANEAMNPFDVVAERAGVLRIPSEFVAK